MYDDIQAAARAWCAAHPLTGPASHGACPFCRKDKCYGVHSASGDGIARWTCFSTAHGDITGGRCGKAGPNGEWFGDALDAEAYRRGVSRSAVLRADGYLAGASRSYTRAAPPPSPPKPPPAPTLPPLALPEPPRAGALDGWRLEGSRLRSHHDRLTGEPLSLTWEELLAWFKSPARLPAAGKDALPAWTAAVYDGANPHAIPAGSLSVRHSAIVLDFDSKPNETAPSCGEPELSPERLRTALARALPGVAWAAHTTSSSRPGAWRWRVLVPLASPVGRAEYVALVHLVRRLLLEGTAAPFAAESDVKHNLKTEGLSYVPAFEPARLEDYASVAGTGGALDGGEELEALARRVGLNLEALSTRLENDCEALRTEKIERWKRLRNVAALGFLRPNAAWLTEAPPPRRYLLHDRPDRAGEELGAGVLSRGVVAILGAAGGSGKTFALAGLALSIVSGTPWLGRFPLARGGTGRAVLILGEEREDEVRRRLYAQASVMLGARKAAAAIERLLLLPAAGLSSLALTQTEQGGAAAATKFASDLYEYLEAEAGPGWDAILLDPLSHLAGPDTETDNAAATRLLQVLSRFCALPGEPVVMVAHHVSKSSRRENGDTGAGAIRGSSAIVDNARWAALMEPADAPNLARSYARLRIVKSNYAPPLSDSDGVLLVRDAGGALREANPNEAAEHRRATTKATPTTAARSTEPAPVRGIPERLAAEIRAAELKYDKARIKAGDDADKLEQARLIFEAEKRAAEEQARADRRLAKGVGLTSDELG